MGWERFSVVGACAMAAACSDGNRSEVEPGPDCSVEQAFEFRNISNFAQAETGWYLYQDATPGGIPVSGGPTNVPQAVLEPPGRCGDLDAMRLQASGHNFWGAGFADWFHNQAPAVGTGYEGISLWVRSGPNAETTFLFHVFDGQNAVLGDATNPTPPGERAPGTSCLMPPPSSVGEPDCYARGGEVVTGSSRVPAPNECGNSFHTFITATQTWQLVLIPFEALVQYPCPNRLPGGINPADIRKFEIKTPQGMTYDLFIDEIQFYRHPGFDAGAGAQ